MRLFRPGFLAGCLYPEALFRIQTTEKVLYLTFDDGPDQVSTPQLLDILARYNIRVVFFCNGNAAEKNPDLLKLICSRGHLIGNHGYSHLDGWRTNSEKYCKDIIRASAFTSTKIFRPPFGRLSVNQKKKLSGSYKIVFWDIMAYDFDTEFGGEKCLAVLKRKVRTGSIIVLHDMVSSCANDILEEFIMFAQSEGYRFELIEKGKHL
jgi:peptidoglycan/xylan/chitin deacetylase (PgdA/CDA1 family)